MNRLHFGIARGWRFSVMVAVLLGMLHGVGWGLTHFHLDGPQDNPAVRQSVWERVELKPLATEFNDIVTTRLWPLNDDEIGTIFGPILAQRPQDLVLPIFDRGGRMVAARAPYGDPGKSRVELRAIGDVGYVELYFSWDGRVDSAAFYHRADKGFVPMRTATDFPKRLEWDTAQFERIKQWLDAHFPKTTDLGEVVIGDHDATTVHLGNGKDALVSIVLNSPTSYWVLLHVDGAKEGEPEQGVLDRKIDRPDEPLGFQVDGLFFRLTPKLKNPPTVMNLGLVALSVTNPTRLDVGPDRECIATLHAIPGFQAIYLAVKCKSYSQTVIKPFPMRGDPVTFPIDGNFVSFIPTMSGH